MLATAAQAGSLELRHAGDGDPPPGDPAAVGQWEAPRTWTFEAAHAALLPTGKVLAWLDEFEADVRLWDPATDTMKVVPPPDDGGRSMFCAGHVLLPDGRLLVVGGHGVAQGLGNAATYLFDPWTETWSLGPELQHARWYPTALTLADGSVLVVAGRQETAGPVNAVEVLRPGSDAWEVLRGAELGMETYPKLHLLPSGEVVRAGQEPEVQFLDTTHDLPPGAQRWREGPAMAAGWRWYGGSVLLPGLDRVLAVGGWDTTPALVPVATAEVLELTGPEAPRWRATTPMHHPRTDLTTLLLPTGEVLAMGGSDVQPWGPGVLTPELYDPDEETWTVLAGAQRSRGHHSVALLLPDGRVLAAGGDAERPDTTSLLAHGRNTAEVFHPPYLFQGPRPHIADVPQAWGYGEAIPLASPDAHRIAGAALARLASATHSVVFDQRLVPLEVEGAGLDALTLRAPAAAERAPPGWYLLFLRDADGVPSEGAMVHLS